MVLSAQALSVGESCLQDAHQAGYEFGQSAVSLEYLEEFISGLQRQLDDRKKMQPLPEIPEEYRQIFTPDRV
jgi:hypothetical protein